MRVLLLFLFILFHLPVYASGEFLLGVNSGHVDFSITETDLSKSQYSSFNMGMETHLRLSFDFGIIKLGVAGYSSWNDMNLLLGTSSGSDNTFQHYYHGPFLGLMVNDEYRLNFEYYLSSTHEFMWTQSRSSNPFLKGDKILGTGYGAGISRISNRFIVELMLQVFLPNQTVLNNTEFKVSDNIVSEYDIANVSLSIGVRF